MSSVTASKFAGEAALSYYVEDAIGDDREQKKPKRTASAYEIVAKLD